MSKGGAKKAPHPLLTLIGLALMLALVGAGAWAAGFCVAWVSDVAFGVKP